jgi:hypothetical protein
MTTPPLLPSHNKPDWWKRNWKWFVPVLCILTAGSFTGFVYTVSNFMKSSGAYILAVEKTKAHPAVIELIGTPVEEKGLTTGNVQISGSSGKAELVIPISGPKESATIHVVARKVAGQWQFDHLVVQINGDHQRIDLLNTE